MPAGHIQGQLPKDAWHVSLIANWGDDSYAHTPHLLMYVLATPSCAEPCMLLLTSHLPPGEWTSWLPWWLFCGTFLGCPLHWSWTCICMAYSFVLLLAATPCHLVSPLPLLKKKWGHGNSKWGGNAACLQCTLIKICFVHDVNIYKNPENKKLQNSFS